MIENVERPFVIAGVGKRAPVGGEHAGILRVLDRGLFEHGNGLRPLAIGAQRPRVVDHRFGIGRVRAVAFAPRQRGAPIGTGARRGSAKRSGRLRRLRRLATGKRESEHCREQNRRETLNPSGRFGIDRASHHDPRRAPQTGSGNKALTLTRS
jgi:hypothetical protein